MPKDETGRISQYLPSPAAKHPAVATLPDLKLDEERGKEEGGQIMNDGVLAHLGSSGLSSPSCYFSLFSTRNGNQPKPK